MIQTWLLTFLLLDFICLNIVVLNEGPFVVCHLLSILEHKHVDYVEPKLHHEGASAQADRRLDQLQKEPCQGVILVYLIINDAIKRLQLGLVNIIQFN